MSNRFSDRLAQLSQARSALSTLQSRVAPLLNDQMLGNLELIGDALANIETDLKAASDVLDNPPDPVPV